MLAGLPPALHAGRRQGRIVAHDKHLLSMKDNDQSANLRALADAGIRSFKIEGR
jgi:collagenase-like PrtC family protease